MKATAVKSTFYLVIKSNNYIAREICPVCGKLHKDSFHPEWIFPNDSYEGICLTCAKKECPDLLKKVTNSAQRLWGKNSNV
jgi:hypothetical protein